MMFKSEQHREDIEYKSTLLMANKANSGKGGVRRFCLGFVCTYAFVICCFNFFLSCGFDAKINNGFFNVKSQLDHKT